MSADRGEAPPILAQKHYSAPSAFTPENLLREARRQKQIADACVPEICILDPDLHVHQRQLYDVVAIDQKLDLEFQNLEFHLF